MANLFFPQLMTGAIAQYPATRMRQWRSVQNVLADGSVLAFTDVQAARRSWLLHYEHLSFAEMSALQTLFDQCEGALLPFTFIDPMENMYDCSADLSAPVWQADAGLTVTPGQADPLGGRAAFTLTNNSQIPALLAQTLPVPANYQYCMSWFVRADVASAVSLVRRGVNDSASEVASASSLWQRATSAGALNDPSIGISAGVQLAPGQQVQVFGPQLEPQNLPSRYRRTAGAGGVYGNAYWAMEQFAVGAEMPNLYSTSVSIEVTA